MMKITNYFIFQYLNEFFLQLSQHFIKMYYFHLNDPLYFKFVEDKNWVYIAHHSFPSAKHILIWSRDAANISELSSVLSDVCEQP